MTDEELAAIRNRVEAATPGPWAAEMDRDDGPQGAEWIRGDIAITSKTDILGRVYMNIVHEDATFIAHAREDVPALLAEVERLRSEAILLKAQTEGVASLLLDVQQDCLVAKRENADMREVVRAVTDLSATGNDLCFCYHHDDTRNFSRQTEEWLDMGKPHKPECIYAKARALLGVETT